MSGEPNPATRWMIYLADPPRSTGSRADHESWPDFVDDVLRHTLAAESVHIVGGHEWTVRALLAADLIEALEAAHPQDGAPFVTWDAQGFAPRVSDDTGDVDADVDADADTDSDQHAGGQR